MKIKEMSRENIKPDFQLFVVLVSSFLMLICGESFEGVYANRHVALFVFGDSLFDPGNNNFINTTTYDQANFWPYGESYFNPPSGRFTNGRIIPDFIAEYARLPLIPAYLDPSFTNNDFLYGANFASGGAGVLDETTAGFVVTLNTQLQYFWDLEKQFRQNLGDGETKQLLSNAVYLISCGGNDYSSMRYPNTLQQQLKMVIGNLTNVFKGITEKGGRKIAILKVPQLACFPMTRAMQSGSTCSHELDLILSLHNQEVSKKLQVLEKQIQRFMYAIFDYNTTINNRMKNPSQYGFKVGDTACCGSGPFRGIFSCGREKDVEPYELCDNVNDYLFFDAGHPTEVAYRQLAELFWNGDSSVTSPYNLKMHYKKMK